MTAQLNTSLEPMKNLGYLFSWGTALERKIACVSLNYKVVTLVIYI